MLEPVAQGLFVVAAPLTMLGLHLGTRMTVLRLPDGTVLLHSPVPISPELQGAVDAVGPVAHIVAPNLYHHLHAGAWAAAYPKAQLHAPAGLRAKRPDLRIDADLEAAPSQAAFAGALQALPIAGSLLHETVLLHPESRTLISADLVENFTTSDHWLTRQYLKVAGIHGRPGLAKPLRLLFRDRPAARRSIDAVLAQDFDRLILAHGQIIQKDAREIVRQTYAGWL